MAYSKLPRVHTDLGLGIQTVNAAIENEKALRDAYDVQHDVTLAQLIGGGVAGQVPGRHNHSTIPRGVALIRTASYTYASGFTFQALWFDIASQTKRIVNASRIAQGLFFISTTNLDPTTTWFEVTAVSSSAVRLANSRYYALFAGGLATGCAVHLFELNSTTGTFEAADYDFSLAIFSTN